MQRFLIERDFPKPTPTGPGVCTSPRGQASNHPGFSTSPRRGSSRENPTVAVSELGALWVHSAPRTGLSFPRFVDWVQSAAVSAMAIRAAFSSTMA